MKFCVITHVEHVKYNNQYFGYAPYIREMNIWLKYVDKVLIVAPIENKTLNVIQEPYIHQNLEFIKVSRFDIISIKSILVTLIRLPLIIRNIYQAMNESDHIHLRCPGNIGLLGCLVQMFFPNKKKTAKYAGNWDPNAKQPLSYKVQKWILSNTFLTRNMQVLVYGEWTNQTKNIKPFFTATYSEQEVQKSKVESRKFSSNTSIRFLFVGALVKGKQPLYAVKLLKCLKERGIDVYLDLYGEGAERGSLENYIKINQLSDIICINGNQSKETVLNAYQSAHFLILPSKSEGWPKVVAEAMFWGCVPVATRVSSVPYMLDFGNRGILLEMELKSDLDKIAQLIGNTQDYILKSEKAMEWSRKYTLEYFDTEIKKLI